MGEEASVIFLGTGVQTGFSGSLITLGAIVLLLRGFQRLSLTIKLQKLFNVPVWLNVLHAAYLLSLALALFWLRPKQDSVNIVS